MREEHLLVQNLMFLTINVDCCIILGGIGTAKLITYTMSFEDLENLFSSLLQEHITMIWGVLCPFPQKNDWASSFLSEQWCKTKALASPIANRITSEEILTSHTCAPFLIRYLRGIHSFCINVGDRLSCSSYFGERRWRFGIAQMSLMNIYPASSNIRADSSKITESEKPKTLRRNWMTSLGPRL